MNTVYNTCLVNEKCPGNMTESVCPLRNYIKNEQDLFHISINETYLVQNTMYDREKFMRVYDEMHRICQKCHADNKQKTR